MAKSSDDFLRTFVRDMTEHAAAHGIGETFVKICEGFCNCGEKVAEQGAKFAAVAAGTSLLSLPVLGPLTVSLALFGVTVHMKCAREAIEAKKRDKAFDCIREISAAVAAINQQQDDAQENLIALVERKSPVWARISGVDQRVFAQCIRHELKEEFKELNQFLHDLGTRGSDTNERVRIIEQSLNIIIQENGSYVVAIEAGFKFVNDKLDEHHGESSIKLDKIFTAVEELTKVGREDRERLVLTENILRTERFRAETLEAEVGQLKASMNESRRFFEEQSRVAAERGELNQSGEYLHRALEISKALSDVVAEAVYLSNQGIIAGQSGKMNTARDYLQQALAICEGDQTKPRLIVGKRLVTPEEATRRRLESEQRTAAGIAKPDLEDDELEVSNLLQGEFAKDTEAAIRRALTLKETEGNAHGNLGRIALTLGEMGVAKREFMTSLSIHESTGFLTGIAMTSMTLGHLAIRDGRTDDACSNWKRAKELFARLGENDKSEAVAREMQTAKCSG